MTQFRRHLTHNLVAYLALFIALGGTSYALTLPKNSVSAKHLKKSAVTSAKIKKNAVSSSKVKDSSLLAKDFKLGQLPKGAPGPAGAPGAPGAPGSPGVSGLQTVTAATAIDSDDTKAINANCPGDKRAISSGFYLVGAGGASPPPGLVLRELSYGAGQVSSYAGVAELTPTALPWGLVAVARCADATP